MDRHSHDQGPENGIREEVKTDARTLGETAKSRAFDEADRRKGEAARQAKSVASALDRAAGELDDSPQWLRSAFESGSRTLQRLADSVETRDARDLGREVTRLARENPVTFLGVSALLGFAAARVLKAGAAQSGSDRRDERMDGEAAMPLTVEPGTDMSAYPAAGGPAPYPDAYRNGGQAGGQAGAGGAAPAQGAWS